MDFYEAIKAVQDGKVVRRERWEVNTFLFAPWQDVEDPQTEFDRFRKRAAEKCALIGMATLCQYSLAHNDIFVFKYHPDYFDLYQDDWMIVP